MALPDERVVLGVITRPHGIKGGVRVKVFNPDTSSLVAGANVYVTPKDPGNDKDNAARRVRVQSVQPAAETWIVYLAGIATHEAAEALRGAEISVERSQLPPLEDGEFYHRDLVGCEVRDEADLVVGTVLQVIAYPSVDALEVKSERGEIEIPIVDGIVLKVDAAARRITIDRAALDEILA